jgi:hypothetical protein
MVEKFQRYSAYGDIETCVSVPVETLQEIRSCIIGFEADKAANLLPTDASISRARDLIRSTLNAPRKFEPAHLAAAE